MDPRAVPAGPVLQDHRARDRAALVPPRGAGNVPRQRLAESLEQSVDDVHVVHHAAEVGVRKGEHGCGRAVSDRLLDLLRFGALRRLDHLARHVRPFDDVTLGEERHPLRVVARHADVTQVFRRVRELCKHPLPGGIVAFHIPDLHHLVRAVARGDDPVGIGERDAERLLDEDVQTRVEGVNHDLGMGGGGGRDQHGVDTAGGEQLAGVLVHTGHPVARGHRFAHGSAGIGERRDLEAVGELQKVLQVLCLRDHSAPDDPDPDSLAAVHTPTLRACLGARSTW